MAPAVRRSSVHERVRSAFRRIRRARSESCDAPGARSSWRSIAGRRERGHDLAIGIRRGVGPFWCCDVLVVVAAERLRRGGRRRQSPAPYPSLVGTVRFRSVDCESASSRAFIRAVTRASGDFNPGTGASRATVEGSLPSVGGSESPWESGSLAPTPSDAINTSATIESLPCRSEFSREPSSRSGAERGRTADYCSASPGVDRDSGLCHARRAGLQIQWTDIVEGDCNG